MRSRNGGLRPPLEVRNLNAEFSRTLSLLRQEKGVSQRTAAGVLGISQALLSHYENGIREPGLAFVVKACDYYGVSADYLLGRTLTRDGTTIGTEELYDISDERTTPCGAPCWLCCPKAAGQFCRDAL